MPRTVTRLIGLLCNSVQCGPHRPQQGSQLRSLPVINICLGILSHGPPQLFPSGLGQISWHA